MDVLDRVTEVMEAKSRFTYCEPESAPEIKPKTKHNITIIGVIRGVDGWYRAGFDENTKTIVPLELIERRSIYFNDDCPMCKNSDPDTNLCYDIPINGGTPCKFYKAR
jgi:hypothetical protein